MKAASSSRACLTGSSMRVPITVQHVLPDIVQRSRWLEMSLPWSS